MVRPEDTPRDPEWIDTLPMAVWVVGDDGRITHVNDEAARLLGRTSSALVGSPCHEAIAGRREDGAPLCGAHCPIRDVARRCGRVDAFDLRITTPGGPRWLEVSVGVLRTSRTAGVRLVHLATDVGRERRAARFVERLAGRSDVQPADRRPEDVLSNRELDVLRQLACDATLEEIASTLGVRHATVRNHVQHILQKLGAHSMLEAIARLVLDDG